MPGWGGIELIKYLNQNNYPTPVMVMSSVRDQRTIQEAFELGVIGYIPKSYGTQDIVNVIEGFRDGAVHVPGFFDADQAAHLSVEKQEAQVKLTKRQAEILSLMDQGLSNQQIADTLFIGTSTVKTHVSQIFKLFGVTGRIACLRAAKETGALQ